MRIIAGRFKGIKIHVPGKRGVRPTTERVREALFSTLGDTVQNSHVLELFAGSGAFGFEALSRGAETVVFVDTDRKLTQALSQTAALLRVEQQVQILNMDVFKALSKLSGKKVIFDIVFCDPPYGQDWIRKLLSIPWLTDIIDSEGSLILEFESKLPDCEFPAGFETRFTKKYGDTTVRILKKK